MHTIASYLLLSSIEVGLGIGGSKLSSSKCRLDRTKLSTSVTLTPLTFSKPASVNDLTSASEIELHDIEEVETVK